MVERPDKRVRDSTVQRAGRSDVFPRSGTGAKAGRVMARVVRFDKSSYGGVGWQIWCV